MPNYAGLTISDYKGNVCRINKDGTIDKRYKWQPKREAIKPQVKAKKSSKVVGVSKPRKIPFVTKLVVLLWVVVVTLALINIWMRGVVERIPSYEYLPVLSPYGEVDEDGRWNITMTGPKEIDSREYCQTEYEKMVCAKDWDDRLMVALMYAESGGDPTNVFHEADGTVSTGLFQINSVHGYDHDTLIDPQKNIDIAYKIWTTSDVYPWGAYNDGRVWEFYR